MLKDNLNPKTSDLLESNNKNDSEEAIKLSEESETLKEELNIDENYLVKIQYKLFFINISKITLFSNSSYFTMKHFF